MDETVVIPAKAGIQKTQQVMGSGSSLCATCPRANGGPE